MAFISPSTRSTGDIVTAAIWNQDVVYNAQDLAQSGFTVVLDGGGAAISTGVKLDVEIPYDCTIAQVTALADQSGSIVVDCWVDTYANYPPTDADTITAAAPVTITTDTKSQDSTLTGWTKTLAQGKCMRFNVDSCTTITRVCITFRVTRPD